MQLVKRKVKVETWITILTLAIILFFVVIFFFFVKKDYNKRDVSKNMTNFVFVKYEQKLDKIDKLFQNEKLSKILDECKLEIDDETEKKEEFLYENIKTVDAIEDNMALLKRVKKEFSHRGEVQDKINLLKKNLKIYNLQDYVVKPKNPKWKAISEFSDKLKFVELIPELKKILSATPCYYLGYNFMFLSKHILKIDLENVFSVEYIDYKDVGVKVWLKDEEEIEFDGTYDLSETEYNYPEGKDASNPMVKALVYRKNYVLSISYKDMTYDFIQGEVLLNRQKEMDKLIQRKF